MSCYIHRSIACQPHTLVCGCSKYHWHLKEEPWTTWPNGLRNHAEWCLTCSANSIPVDAGEDTQSVRSSGFQNIANTPVAVPESDDIWITPGNLQKMIMPNWWSLNMSERMLYGSFKQSAEKEWHYVQSLQCTRTMEKLDSYYVETLCTSCL